MADSKAHLQDWKKDETLLIYGIGNPGRQDDGLGIRLIEKLEKLGLPQTVHLDSNYQLNVEDALTLSHFDWVVFLDASVDVHTPKPYLLSRLEPAQEWCFSTHAMRPQSVLSLCHDLYGKKPHAFLLAIPGYQWELSEEMSDCARENLEHTFQFLSSVLSVS